MHLYTQNAKTTHFRWLEMSGFVLGYTKDTPGLSRWF